MENAEEIKIKSIRVALNFELLFKRAVKRKLVDYNVESDIKDFRERVRSYSGTKSAVMWTTRRVNPDDLAGLNLPGVKIKDVKYLTVTAYNPVRQPDLSFPPVIETFLFEEFVSSLKRLASKVVRDEAKAQRFEILEAATQNTDLDYSKIGIINSDGKYLPSGSNIISNLWLKK